MDMAVEAGVAAVWLLPGSLAPEVVRCMRKQGISV